MTWLYGFHFLIGKNLFITGTSNIKIFVLDEADEMLSRGFKDQIHDVFRTLGTEVQVSSIVNMLILIVFKVIGFVPRWNNLIYWIIILCWWGGGVGCLWLVNHTYSSIVFQQYWCRNCTNSIFLWHTPNLRLNIFSAEHLIHAPLRAYLSGILLLCWVTGSPILN